MFRAKNPPNCLEFVKNILELSASLITGENPARLQYIADCISEHPKNHAWQTDFQHWLSLPEPKPEYKTYAVLLELEWPAYAEGVRRDLLRLRGVVSQYLDRIDFMLLGSGATPLGNASKRNVERERQERENEKALKAIATRRGKILQILQSLSANFASANIAKTLEHSIAEPAALPTSEGLVANAGAVSANKPKIFPRGEPHDRDYVEFVLHFDAHRSEHKSDNACARDYTGETEASFPKATKFLARMRMARRRGGLGI